MKKINLIERLWTDSHEKQSPQRFARYAAMLIMLLTLGVGQMWATYYYRGGKNSWGATAMTNVNGIYSYYSATSGAHQFKISTSTSSYDYNYTYVTKNYKQTDVSDIGDYGKNNCYCWQSSAHYILVFNPNTSVNSTNKPIICAATALPSAGFEEDGNTISYYNNVDGDKQSSALDRASGTTIDLTSKAITSLYLKAFNTKMYQHYEVNLLGASNYHFYYKIHRTAEAAGSTGFTEVTSADGYSAGSVTWGSFDGSKYRKPTYYVTANQSLLSGLGSGLYTMSYYFTHVGTTETYRLPSTSSKYNELKWKIPVPSVTSGAVTSNGTGTGEEGSPFSVADGNTITFTASGSQASTDANSILYVKWGSDSYAPASSTTKTITPTTTKQSMTVKLKYYNSADDLSGAETTLTIYYQSTLTPSIGISSISPSPANSGDEVTITASRQNAGEANITYQYSLNGESGWTTIGSATSSTTKTWTVPAITTTTTYYFRAQMTYSATTYTSDVVSLKAYGKKTIKVKDTNGWGANFKIHRWGGDAERTTWPGETTNITSAGGQWKQVVLYSSSTDFLFDNSSDPDNNKTANKKYADMSDGSCYVIQSGSGGSLTLTSTDCPSAPSVTTASASSVATTSATFNASGVNANNDAITAYGFKWGTTDACSSGTVPASNLGAGTTFSATKSSLTNGTTYYFKAYATNGQGTTYGSAVSVRTKFITTVTLDQEGGSDGTEEVTATEGSAMPSGATAPGKSGYTFGGYYASAGGSGTKYYNANMTSAHNWDVAASTATIHAMWTPTTYSITYHTNGGSAISAGSYNIETATFALPTTSEKTGYTFAGWYTNAELTGDPVSSIAIGSYGNKEYWAKWTPNTYTVSFDVNGGTASTPDSKNVTYDAAYGTLPGGMTHASKQFIGWYTDSRDGEGDLITAETIESTASNHTLYAHYENVYSVNVNFKCGEASIYPSTSVEASPTSLRPTITAPEVFGYSFENWTGTNVTFADESSATTTITATAATSVTANYSVVPTVYFKNNLGWENVYVTFDSYWKEAGGKQVPGNKDKPYYKMTQIGSSDVFYCPIPEGCVSSWKWNIAFDNTGYGYNEETHIGTYDPFYEGEFTGRGDFDQKATMFIPYNGDTETRNSGTFYKSGCWMKYNSTESGYQVKMNEYVDGAHADLSTTNLTAPTAGGYEFSAKVSLGTANYSYGFKLYKPYQENYNDLWYTNTGDITSATSSLPWAFWSGPEITADTRRCGLHTEALGDYKITVSFATGKPMVDIEYPVTVGDWKLVYKDRATWSGAAHSASWCHPSRVIKAKADAEDIVSFYVAYGSTPSIELHKCTAINPSTGAQTWEKQGADLDLSDITATGIYNFKVTQDGSKNATAAYDGEYEGNFYIRTDASDGGWTNYKSSGKNLMTYSEYSLTHGGDFGPYSHYFMRFASKGTNIKFCIANDYSEAISDTVVSDTYTNEYIDADGNVRFMWYSSTNKIGRAYLSGSTIVSDRFLVLEGDNKMFDESGNALTTAGGGKIIGLNDYEMKFTDNENWIYEATVKAQPGARIKLTAKYNDKIQYFYGAEGARSDETTELLLGGSDESLYKVRVVYDFKTNRLMRAFIPDGTITADLAINADMMIIREHQQDAHQISFSGSGALSEVKTVYGAMKFNKWTVNGKEKTGGHARTNASRFERDLFYISFPFDVKLNDVFGFGEYGKHWIIEYYDGKGRAAKGFWADSEPNWKFVMPSQRNSFTMKAFEGYILALDLDEMAESSDVWKNNVEDVYIYFPSSAEVKDIEATNRSIPIDQTGYECTINRPTPDGDRRVKDSYWHCIGVPSFANYNRDLTVTNGGTTIDWSDDDGTIDWSTPSLPYLYEVNWSSNTLNVTTSATFNFKATWSYLVQYAGTSIYWSQVNVTPASIVARERTAPKNAEFRIELQKDGQKADQTFVRLTEDENVTNGFDFNYDLSKEFNKNKPNIYSLVTTVKEGVASVTQSAANVQPMTEQTTVIPVGVKIAAAGDYTFAIPEGTNGVGVTLIDNETGVRTNLSALDYTINLSAGTYDERFVLEISPIMQTPTGIEQIGGDDANGARKMLIDGVLYIVKDGKIFDAQGRKMK